METIECGGLVYSVRYSRRRTVCIRVLDDGTPQILAPIGISKKELMRIALPYTERIFNECERKREEAALRDGFVLFYGDHVDTVMGKCRICPGDDGRVSYDSECFYIPPKLSGDEVRDAVVAVYKLLAKDYLTTRVSEIAPLLGCDVKAVKINSATSHWASCSRRDTLNFSWFCVMAKQEAVDYIIIHELCHMYEFNHSPKFWALVSRYCPDYKVHRNYLKKLWQGISKQNWKN